MAETPYQKLPLELRGLIFSFRLSRPDFLNLSHSKKSFNQVVEPSLYSTFSWIPEIISGFEPSLPHNILKNRNIRSLTKTRRQESRFCLAYFRWTATVSNSLDIEAETCGLCEGGEPAGADTFQARECGIISEELAPRKKMIDLLPSVLQACWTNALHSVELRVRDASAIGGSVFEALRGCSSAQGFFNLKAIKFSVGRFKGERIRDILDHSESDIFDTYAPVPAMLQYEKLEYICPPVRPDRAGSATLLLEDLTCELFYDDDVPECVKRTTQRPALDKVQGGLKRLVININISSFGHGI
ncbi:unnamed protein product [Diplocarpon coronariae]